MTNGCSQFLLLLFPMNRLSTEAIVKAFVQGKYRADEESDQSALRSEKSTLPVEEQLTQALLQDRVRNNKGTDAANLLQP
eukprot:scaffold1252_cov154-Amphora_coffeaeformis.AAC.6